MEREPFWDIVALLGLGADDTRVGIGGSLYRHDVEAIGAAVGVPYLGERVRTWMAIIEALGGTVDDRDWSANGTVTNAGLVKVRDLLRAHPDLAQQVQLLDTNTALDDVGAFDPEGLDDTRQFALAQVCRRQGQSMFRAKLIQAYGGQCCITGTACLPVLEAAHICAYQGIDWNDVTNGLLLRADMHTLFDLRDIVIDADYVVRTDGRLRDTEYADLDGVGLWLPEVENMRPSPLALAIHRATE